MLPCWIPAASAQVELIDAFPNLPAFNRPVDLQYAGDEPGRFYVVEQQGLILSFEDDPAAGRVDTLLDLRAQTRLLWIEDGLLGLAFHPDYAANGQVFVYYLAADPPRGILARFTRSAEDPLRVDPASGQIVLEIPQVNISHNGGGLGFGPDGYLYLSLGDGGCCGDPEGHAPDRTTLPGALLRLDVDHPGDERAYGIPADNPFVGNTEGWREEIYAYGLRNPWQFSFDPATGDIWLGDVGEGTFEEIDRIEAGGHYGWHVLEGTRCHTPVENCEREGLIEPVWVYYHGPHGAIIGGYVYRGQRMPELIGKYVYGDWVSGQLWALTYDDSTGTATNEDLLASGLRISTFGVDGRGELYVADHAGGRIFALQKIVAVATASEDPAGAADARFELAGPNPFRTETAFVFTVERAAPVRLSVYDVLGREVAVLFEGHVTPSTPQRVPFSAVGLPAGIYFCQLRHGAAVQVRTAVVLP